MAIRPPLCRYCGKPIPKVLDSIYVCEPDTKMSPRKGLIIPGRFLTSKAECQTFVNQGVVVNVRYWDHPPTRRVYRFTVWDETTYVSEFFCKDRCALDFGYLMARGNHCTIKYNEMLELQSVTKESG